MKRSEVTDFILEVRAGLLGVRLEPEEQMLPFIIPIFSNKQELPAIIHAAGSEMLLKTADKMNRRTIGGWWGEIIHRLIYIAQTRTSSFVGSELKMRGAIWGSPLNHPGVDKLLSLLGKFSSSIALSNDVLTHIQKLQPQKGKCLKCCQQNVFQHWGIPNFAQ